MATWPRIKSQRRALLRADGTIQFGLDPRQGVRLEGLTAAEVRWVQGLDGTHDAVADGVDAGLDASRLDGILEVLRRADVLAARGAVPETARSERSLPPPDGRPGRRRATVWVQGGGPVAATVTDLLRQAGVGRVVRSPDSRLLLDVGRRRLPHLVLLVTGDVIGEAAGRPWQSRGIVHIPVHVTSTVVGVGPVITPGQPPCLACLEFVREELDPAWPHLRAQLPRGADGPVASTEESLAAIGAGFAARFSLDVLDGHPLPSGMAVDVELPWPIVQHRHWPGHPRCGCHAGAGRRQETMGA